MKHMKNKHLTEYVKVIETQLKEFGKEINQAVVQEKELKINNTKFCFSGVKTCDKCGAVFRNDSLLKDHEQNDHEKNIEIEIEDEIPKEVSTKQQLHCALTDSPDCQFQCETKEQLQRHIETEHRAKTHLQCTVCNIVFRNIDNLSTHMNSTHKKSDEGDLQYSCRSCQEKFKTKSELDMHIIAEHKSHKPCITFATDSCEYTKCRYIQSYSSQKG